MDTSGHHPRVSGLDAVLVTALPVTERFFDGGEATDGLTVRGHEYVEFIVVFEHR